MQPGRYTGAMILSSGPSAGSLWLAAHPALLWPSVVSLLAYIAAAVWPEAGASRWRAAFVLAWMAHAVAIVVDVGGVGAQGAGARFGFAPAVSATLWLVVGVYGVESRLVPMTAARRALALCAASGVALALLFPGEFRPHVGAAWAPLHWVLGLASYGLFGVAVLHAALQGEGEKRMRLKSSGASGATGLPLLRIERLTFRFVGAGFVVLSAAIVLGWWFMPQWRWDHKTVFSLLGWTVFAALLAGRRAFGWRGRRASRWLYAGAALLLLAYVGSRFVLEVVLQRVG